MACVFITNHTIDSRLLELMLMFRIQMAINAAVYHVWINYMPLGPPHCFEAWNMKYVDGAHAYTAETPSGER